MPRVGNSSEKFKKGDSVMKSLNIDDGESLTDLPIKAGIRYEVEECVNGSTSLTNIKENVSTENLQLWPNCQEDMLVFALSVINEQLTTVPDAAKLAGVSQVYFRGLVNEAADHQLPNYLYIEIGGKQFIRRSFPENIIKKKEAKVARQKQRLQASKDAREYRPKPDLFDDAKYDELEYLTLPELKDIAKLREINIYQNKPRLISCIRQHRAERTTTKGDE